MMQMCECLCVCMCVRMRVHVCVCMCVHACADTPGHPHISGSMPAGAARSTGLAKAGLTQAQQWEPTLALRTCSRRWWCRRSPGRRSCSTSRSRAPSSLLSPPCATGGGVRVLCARYRVTFVSQLTATPALQDRLRVQGLRSGFGV